MYPNKFLYNIKDYSFANKNTINKQDLYLLLDGNLNVNIGSSVLVTFEYLHDNILNNNIKIIINKSIDFFKYNCQIENLLETLKSDDRRNSVFFKGFNNFLYFDYNSNFCNIRTEKYEFRINLNIDISITFFNNDDEKYFIIPWRLRNNLDDKNNRILHNFDYKLNSNENLGGHITSLLIQKNNSNSFNIYFINSGLGLERHMSLDSEYYPFRYLNISKNIVNKIFFMSYLLQNKNFNIHIDIENLYELLDKIIDKKKEVDSNFKYKNQLSGSCSFYSIIIAINYYLQLNNINLEGYFDNLICTAIEKFKINKDLFCWDYYNIANIIENKYQIKVLDDVNISLNNYIYNYKYFYFKHKTLNTYQKINLENINFNDIINDSIFLKNIDIKYINLILHKLIKTQDYSLEQLLRIKYVLSGKLTIPFYTILLFYNLVINLLINEKTIMIKTNQIIDIKETKIFSSLLRYSCYYYRKYDLYDSITIENINLILQNYTLIKFINHEYFLEKQITAYINDFNRIKIYVDLLSFKQKYDFTYLRMPDMTESKLIGNENYSEYVKTYTLPIINSFNDFIVILEKLNNEDNKEIFDKEMYRLTGIIKYNEENIINYVIFSIVNLEDDLKDITSVKNTVTTINFLYKNSYFKLLIISILNKKYDKLNKDILKILLILSNIYRIDSQIETYLDKIEKIKEDNNNFLDLCIKKIYYINTGKLIEYFNVEYSNIEKNSYLFLPIGKFNNETGIDENYMINIYINHKLYEKGRIYAKLENLGAKLEKDFEYFTKDNNDYDIFNNDIYLKKNKENKEYFDVKFFNKKNNINEDFKLYFDIKTQKIYGINKENPEKVNLYNKGEDEYNKILLFEEQEIINTMNINIYYIFYYKFNGCEELYYKNNKYIIFNEKYIKEKNINKILVILLKNLVIDIPNTFIVIKDNKYFIFILPELENLHTHDLFYKTQNCFISRVEIIEIDLDAIYLNNNNKIYQNLFSIFRENIYNVSENYSPFQLYYQNKNCEEYLNRQYYLPKFNKKILTTNDRKSLNAKYEIISTDNIFTNEKINEKINVKINVKILCFINKINEIKLNYEKKLELHNNQDKIINDEIIVPYNIFITNFKKPNTQNIDFMKDIKIILNKEVLEQIKLENINNLFYNYYLQYKDFLYQDYIFYMRDTVYNIILCKKLLKLLEYAEESKLNETLNYFKENLSKEYIDLNFEELRLTGQILVEIFSGIIFRNKQTELINNIINDIKNQDNLYDVNQLIMGMGKTAVITPCLILQFLYCFKDDFYNKIILCLPESLKLQTEQLLNNFNILNILNPKLIILSDNELKLNLLHDYNYIENNILIIDEFDTLYNPLSSNLNIPILKEKITKSQLNEIIIREYVDLIVNEIDRNNYNPTQKLNIKLIKNTEIHNKLNDILIKCINMTYNLNYGLTKEENKDFYKAKPYSAAYSPIEESDYSEIDFILILTIMSLAYVEFREKDYENIMNFVLDEYIEYEEFDDTTDLEQIVLIGLDNIYNYKLNKIIDDKIKKSINNNKLFFKKYLINYVIVKLEFTIQQKNISFMDIISLNKVKKIGFSGTTNLTLPYYNDFKNKDYKLYQRFCQNGGDPNTYKYIFNNINKNIDAQGSIYYSILKSEDNDPFLLLKNNTNKYNILDQIICIIKKENKYNCLIDTAGLLFMFNSNEIIKYIMSKLKYERYFYIDNNNNKKILKFNGNKIEEIIYNNEIVTENDFLLYDNKHIIGQDIKQSFNISGLCTVDKKITLSLLAQGIYRLRKINWGQTINFILDAEMGQMSRWDILLKTFFCEETIKYTSYELSKLNQNYKTLYRNYEQNIIKDNFYDLFFENVYNQFNIEKIEYSEFINENYKKFNKFEVAQDIKLYLDSIKCQIINLNNSFNSPITETEISTNYTTNIFQNTNISTSINISVTRFIFYKIEINIQTCSLLDLLNNDIINKIQYKGEINRISNTYTFLNNKIIISNCRYNDIYYIYNKVGNNYYFILINSFVLMNLLMILKEIKGKYSLIIKKDIDTIIYKIGNIENIQQEDIELEAFINFSINNKISLYDFVKAYNYYFTYQESNNNYLLFLRQYLNYTNNFLTPLNLKNTNSMSEIINNLYKFSIEKSNIKIKSKKKFNIINEIVCYIKKINPNFENDFFYLISESTSLNGGSSYKKKYLKYKSKYVNLKYKFFQ
jgi:hypothetical protein